MREPFLDARRTLMAGGLLTALFVALHAGIFVLGRETFSHDTRNWFPVFAYLYDGVREGIFPLWSPYTLTGEPFYFIPPTFRFYDPGTLLMMATCGWIHLPAPTVYHLEILRRIVCFALGGALLLGRFCRDPRVPVLGYGVLLFSSIPLGMFRQHGLILVPYMAPWALWAFHGWWAHPRAWSRNLLLAFALGASIANYQCVYALLFYACYAAAWRILCGGPAADRPTAAGWAARAGLAALVIGVLVAPHLDLFRQRERFVPVLRHASGSAVVSDISVAAPGEGAGSHARGADFAGLVAPGVQLGHFLPIVPCSEALAYLGALAIPGAVLAACFAPGRTGLAWMVPAVLCGWLALGPDAGLAALAYSVVPGFGMVRHMQFFIPFMLLLLFLLWGVGMDILLVQMRERGPQWGRIRSAAAVSAVAVLAVGGVSALYAGSRSGGPFPALPASAMDPARAVLLLQGFAAVPVIAWLGWLRKGRGGTAGFWILGSLMIGELAIYQTILSPYLVSERARIERVGQGGFPFAWSRSWEDALPERPEEDLGYGPLWTRRAAATLPATKHFVAAREYLDLRAAAADPDAERALLSASMPVLRFVSRVRRMSSDNYLAALRGAEGAELSRQVVVHEVRPGLAREFAEVLGSEGVTVEASIEVISFGANHLKARVVNAERGFLFYGDTWHPDWKVVVDDSHRNVIRANHAYKGVFLEPGAHRVSFRFKPAWFTRPFFVSLWFQCVFLAGLAVWAGARALRSDGKGDSMVGVAGRWCGPAVISLVLVSSFAVWKRSEGVRELLGGSAGHQIPFPGFTFLLPLAVALVYQWGVLRLLFPRGVALFALAAGGALLCGAFRWGGHALLSLSWGALFGALFHFLRFTRGGPYCRLDAVMAWSLAAGCAFLDGSMAGFGAVFLGALFLFGGAGIRFRDLAWLSSGPVFLAVAGLWEGSGPAWLPEGITASAVRAWLTEQGFPFWPPSGRTGLGGIIRDGQNVLLTHVGVFSQCILAVVLVLSVIQRLSGNRSWFLGDGALGGKFLALFLACIAWSALRSVSGVLEGTAAPWDPALLLVHCAWGIACVGGYRAWKRGISLLAPFLAGSRERAGFGAASALLLTCLLVTPLVAEGVRSLERAHLHIPGHKALTRHKGEPFYTNIPPILVSHYTGAWAVGGLSAEAAIARDLSRALRLPGPGGSGHPPDGREPDLFFYSLASGRQVDPYMEQKLVAAFRRIEVGDGWQIYRMTRAPETGGGR